MNEVLCKVIAYNLTVLIAAIYELGLPMPEFGGFGAGLAGCTQRQAEIGV